MNGEGRALVLGWLSLSVGRVALWFVGYPCLEYI